MEEKDNLENLNIDEITSARRKAVAETIRPISAEELMTLAAGFLPYPDHPWLLKLTEFIAENPYGTFHHATTNDHVEIIYSYDEEKGLWFLPGKGMGVLQARALQVMKDVVRGGS